MNESTNATAAPREVLDAGEDEKRKEVEEVAAQLNSMTPMANKNKSDATGTRNTNGLLVDAAKEEVQQHQQVNPSIETRHDDDRILLRAEPRQRTQEEEMKHHTRAWHKELLLGLFLRSDPERLSALARETGTSFSRQLFEINSEKRRKRGMLRRHRHNDKLSTTACTEEALNSKCRSTVSELSLVPYALNKFNRTRKKSNDKVGGATQQSEECGTKQEKKKVENPSRTLDELEREVYLRFRKSEDGMKALSHISSKNALGRQKENERALSLSSTSSFSPLSLVYNEYSLVCVSNWAERDEGLTKGERQRAERDKAMNSTRFHQPVASPFFRMCSVCKKWGHYEVECPDFSAPVSSMVAMAKKINIQRTVRGFIERSKHAGRRRGNGRSRARGVFKDDSFENASSDGEYEYQARSNACEVCRSGFDSEHLLLCDGCDCLFHAKCLEPPLGRIPEGDWFCHKCLNYNSDVSSVVEIEGCDGFVIEQSKAISTGGESGNEKQSTENMGLDFRYNSWEAALGLVSRDKLPVQTKRRAMPVQASLKVNDKIVPEVHFSVGELCWARRSNAAEGLPGRDNWWPAIVMIVSEPRAANKRQTETTPYVVKFYGISGSNRVRATAVLPFFQHYEEIAYNQLVGASANYTGDLSLFRKAVEEANSELGCKSLLMTLIKAREICGTHDFEGNDEWHDAIETVQDGFIIRARSDSSTISSAVEMGAIGEDASSWKISHVLAREAEKPPLKEPSPRDTILGSIVSWKPDFESVAEDYVSNSQPIKLQYGVILAVCPASQKALVRPLLQMENIVESSRTVTDARTVLRHPIRSSIVAASIWLRADSLRIVGECPHPTVHSKFLRDVDFRLKEERERLRCQEMIAQPKEIGTIAYKEKEPTLACEEKRSDEGSPCRLESGYGSKKSDCEITTGSNDLLECDTGENKDSTVLSCEVVEPDENAIVDTCQAVLPPRLDEDGGVSAAADAKAASPKFSETGRLPTSEKDSDHKAAVTDAPVVVFETVPSPTSEKNSHDCTIAVDATTKAGEAVHSPMPKKASDDPTVDDGKSAASNTAADDGDMTSDCKKAAKSRVQSTVELDLGADTADCINDVGGDQKENTAEKRASSRTPSPSDGSQAVAIMSANANRNETGEQEDSVSKAETGESHSEKSDVASTQSERASKHESVRNKRGVDSKNTKQEKKEVCLDVDEFDHLMIAPAERAKRRRQEAENAKGKGAEQRGDSKKRRLSSRSPKVPGRSRKESSNKRESSSEIASDPSSEADQMLEMFGDDVYQAERILDERKRKNGRGTVINEYLIKWKGFSLEECTWEPEKNIFNKNFLRLYQIGKVEAVLKKTKEAKQTRSTTAEVLRVVSRGRKMLEGGQTLIRNRLCPFCRVRYRDERSHVAHMKTHEGEANLGQIIEIARFIREDWYKN